MLVSAETSARKQVEDIDMACLHEASAERVCMKDKGPAIKELLGDSKSSKPRRVR